MKTVVFVAAIAAILTSTTIDAAEIRFLHTTAIKPAVDELVSLFEAKTGNKVAASYGPAGAVVQRVRGGEAFDVVIATSSQIADLEKQGIVAEGTKRDLAKVGIGLYVKKGARKPDISTLDSFKQALLKANAIAYIDPASGGASGIYISGLFTRLGIGEELKPKTRSPKVVAEVFDSVASGQADLGLGQLSEIVIDPRIELAGKLPQEIQNVTLFAVGVSSKTQDREAAGELARLLADPTSQGAFKKFGFEEP
jgi:molybdate transport system substrate-binding protein